MSTARSTSCDLRSDSIGRRPTSSYERTYFAIVFCAVMPKFHLARHVATRLDTFYMSSASRRACRARHSQNSWARHVSSQSSSSCRACRAVLFDKLDPAKMHGLDTSNVSSRVETVRDKPSGIWALANFQIYS